MKRHLVLVACTLLLFPIGFLSDLLPEPRDRAGRDARARHEAALAADGALADGVLGAWRRAAEEALRSPLASTLPYAERLALGGDTGAEQAAAFELRLVPPERLHVVTTVGEGARGALLVDVLQDRGALGTVRLAAFGTDATDAAPLDVRWAPPVAGDFVVRVQPLIGSVGAFGFALERRPPLDFPVATDAQDAVRSYFGDARDGGRRDHHGIDVFAPRGTPVLAAADGVVARVARSVRGGLHVWQRAEDDAGRHIGSLYYAHLDTVATLAGTRVARGDVLGTVGNTGNARTTPPHLHFGLYRRLRGPEDPLPLVGRARVPPLTPEAGHPLAPWLAVAAPALNLRAGPGTAFDVIERLAGETLVAVRGVSGDWARVSAMPPDGDRLEGFVAHALLAPPSLANDVLATSVPLLVAPRSDAPRLATLAPGASVGVAGTFGRYRRVVDAGGSSGWVPVRSPSGTLDDGLPDG